MSLVKTEKANIFMDWVWDIIEKYRHNELSIDLSQVNNILNTLTNTIFIIDINSNINTTRDKFYKRNKSVKISSKERMVILVNKNVSKISITNRIFPY